MTVTRKTAALTIVLSAIIFRSGVAFSAPGIRVEPGEVSRFTLEAPGSVIAGHPFPLVIEARDVFDNLVVNYDKKDRLVEVMSVGAGRLQPATVSSSEFKDGRALVNITTNRAETLRLVTREKQTQASGAVTIAVIPGMPVSLDLVMPREATAGVPFKSLLIARDSQGNRIDNRVRASGPLRIQADREGVFRAPGLDWSDFRGGMATVEMSHTLAGEATISFRDEKSGLLGQGKVMILPATFHAFSVIVPDSIVAGQPFPVVLEARDAFGNLCHDYHREGEGAAIASTGSGEIRPDFVPASSFYQGIARVNFIYTKAEQFEIVAREGTSGVPVSVSPPEITVSPEEPARRPEIDLEEQMRLFERHLGEGSYRDALEVLEKMVEASPDDSELRQMKNRLEEVIRIIE